MNQVLLERIKVLLTQNDELMKRVITLKVENAALKTMNKSEKDS